MLLNGTKLTHPVQVTDLLRKGLESDPNGIALASSDRQLSWSALEQASTALASGYREMGLRPGDRIASLMPNRVELVIHYLACLRGGFVFTPLNYRYMAPQIDHALEVSGATLLLAHTERHADLGLSRRMQTLTHGVLWYGDRAGEAQQFEALCSAKTTEDGFPELDPDGPAAIFFTSGSTGPAKGVTHSRASLGWMFASVAAAFQLGDEDIFLPGSSISHIGSFMWTLSSFAAGSTCLLARTYDAHAILTLLRQYRPTVLAMIPAALTALVRDHDTTREDFSSLRLCRAGADKVTQELDREFEAIADLPIDEGYGMTEVGLATLNPVAGEIREGSIGVPVPGFSLSLRDDQGAEVAPGEVGRAWIKSGSRTPGYWQDSAATAEVVRDGWLDSGDLMRGDEDGYLWFFGRKKQIIVHDGSNISPLEVEAALAEHPAVKLVGVVGIIDNVHGENVRAYVTVREEQPRPTAHDLIRFARERVGYRAPEEVVFLEEMPLNPTGKIDRVGLKAMALEHLHPHGL